jgi:hypothetical protein
MPILRLTELRNSGTEQHRLLRRALLGMVGNGTVLTAGRGGPGDPHRYYINPAVLEATYEEALSET